MIFASFKENELSFGRKSSILYDNNFIVGAGVQNMREFTDFISEYKYFVCSDVCITINGIAKYKHRY